MGTDLAPSIDQLFWTLGSFAEKTFDRVALITGHAEFLAALQEDDVAALEPGLHLAHAADIDDGGAMDADELARVEFFHERLEGLSDVVGAAADMEARIVSFGLDPVDVGDGDELNAAANGDGEALQIVGREAVCEQREEFSGGLLILASLASIAGPGDGARQPIGSEGLEEVVDGVGVEGADRVVIVGGDEDGDGHLFDSNGFEDLETVHLRHLNIEEDEVGIELLNGVHGGFAVAALADDADVAIALEQAQQSRTREGFVIHDQRAQGHKDVSAVEKRAV